jgi:hypothetical protein
LLIIKINKEYICSFKENALRIDFHGIVIRNIVDGAIVKSI